MKFNIRSLRAANCQADFGARAAPVAESVESLARALEAATRAALEFWFPEDAVLPMFGFAKLVPQKMKEPSAKHWRQGAF